MKSITQLASLAGLALALTGVAQAQLVQAGGSVAGSFIENNWTDANNENLLPTQSPGSGLDKAILNGISSTVAVDPTEPVFTSDNNAWSSIATIKFDYIDNQNAATGTHASYNLFYQIEDLFLLPPGISVNGTLPDVFSASIAFDFYAPGTYAATPGYLGATLEYTITNNTPFIPLSDGGSLKITYSAFQQTLSDTGFIQEANPALSSQDGTAANVWVKLEYVSPVPEPSTYGLMGAAALLGLVGYRRFKAKKA